MMMTVMAQSVDAHHLGNADELEEFINRAELRLEQHVPDSAHRHQGGDIGKEERGAVNHDSLNLGIQQHRNEKGRHHGKGYGKDRIKEGIAD